MSTKQHKFFKTAHLSGVRKIAPLYRCSICPSTFKTISSLDFHINHQHTLEQDNDACRCDICGAKFDQASALVFHLKTHLNTANGMEKKRIHNNISPTTDRFEEIARALEIEMSEDESDSPPSTTFLVDTEATCFTCFNRVVPRSCDVDLSSDITCEKFCLRRIFRYLGLNTGKIFSDLRSGYPTKTVVSKLEECVESGNFMVILCCDCKKVVERLDTLCEELELLQNKVNRSVQRFYDKLYISNSKDRRFSKVKLLHNRVESRGSLEFDLKFATLIRETLKKHCTSKLKPKTFEVSSATSSVSSTELTNDSLALVKLEPCEYESISEQISSDSSLSHLTKTEMLKISNFRLPTVNEIPHHTSPNNLVTCTLCPTTANSVFGRDILFQRHICCCHLEFLFASLKLPHLSQVQFKAYCEHLLDLELKDAAQSDTKKNSDETPGFLCPYCGDNFHETKVCLVHLIQLHPEMLSRKLILLQKDTSVNPYLLLKNRTRSTIFEVETNKWKCDECGRVFSAFSSLQRHRKSPCKRFKTNSVTTMTAIATSQHGQRTVSCPHCGLKFSSPHGRKLHIQRIHLGKDHNRERTCCKRCGKRMSVSSISRHIKNSCPFRAALINTKSATQTMQPQNKRINGIKKGNEVHEYIDEYMKLDILEMEDEDGDQTNLYEQEDVTLIQEEDEEQKVLMLQVLPNFFNDSSDVDPLQMK